MRHLATREGVVRGIRRVAVATLATLALGAPAAQAAGAPAVGPTWAAGVESVRAVLWVEINPEGLPTIYSFEYTTEAAFLTNGFTGAVKKPLGGEGIGSGGAPVSRSQPIGGLTPATAYRYQVVASNSAGTKSSGPHTLTTDAVGEEFSLPDNRRWEMVSPIDKNGGEVQGFGANFGGDVLQAAAAGGTVTYSSRSSFANAQGAPGASQYLSSRGGSGWSTDNITPATESGAYGDHPNGVPYQLFSSDLSGALFLDGCGAEPCPRSYSLRNNSAHTVSPLPYAEPDLVFAGASPDLAHLVFSTCAALTADATEIPAGACVPTEANLYERSGGAPRLINLLPGDLQGTPGAQLGAQAGAISADGSRVYFSDEPAPGERNLYLREGTQTKQVDETQGGGGTFQTASSNGAIAFFTKGGSLYRYDAGAGTSEALAGEVTGVLGASADGSHVYYLSAAGLFLWRSATATSIPLAPLAKVGISPQADAGSYPPATGSARISSDGSRLAFVSAAELTNYDNRKALPSNGSPEPEVYLYTAPGAAVATLVCVSCNRSGERPIGPASLPGASPNGTGSAATRAYKPRVLSADSSHVFFDSFDALASQDTNKDRDVYQWEAQGSGGCAKPDGCVNLISSGRSEDGASFVDASADGSEAFFLTDGSLVRSDPGKVDLYDARVGGGFPEPEEEEICVGDDCQPLPPEPEDPTPGSLRGGDPNPPVQKPKKHKKHHKHHKKKHAGSHR